MSPLSQCFPQIAYEPVVGASARFATRAEYRAPYRAGRGLSDIPPSTATQVVAPLRLTTPTRYSVRPAGPTSERPGSKISCGVGRLAVDQTSYSRSDTAR